MQATALDPYSPEVRRFFAKPVHAGTLQNSYNQTALGTSAESEDGAKVEIAIGIADDIIVECRYRVYGCPHLVAAAEWLCTLVEGEPLSALSNISVTQCMDVLSVPVDKTGRILLLEDAIRSLHERL